MFRFYPNSVSFSISVLAFCLFFSCKKDGAATLSDAVAEPTLTATDPLLQLMSVSETGIDFQNTVEETFEDNIMNNFYAYNGGGVGIADFNRDGLQDVYFVRTHGENALYLNQGNFKFKDIAKKAGVESADGFETAVTIVDINADGWPDIYLSRAGNAPGDIRRNKLFINQGIGTDGKVSFLEKAKSFGLDVICRTMGTVFFDYDRDGDLDCYMVNYPDSDLWALQIDVQEQPDGTFLPNTEPKSPVDSDRLYRNDGPSADGYGWTFTNVSEAAGIRNFAYGLSVSVSDLNRDGWPDIYVGNDFIHPDFLYINNKNGTFTNRLPESVKHTSQHTMGIDLSDFDNDGLVDIYSLDMQPAPHYRKKTLNTSNTQSKYTSLIQGGYFEPVVRNVLHKNNGDGTFQDVACLAGVDETDWSWSGLFFDMDNDGLRDLHVTNGIRREISRFDVMDFVIPEVLQKYKAGQDLSQQFKTIQEFLNKIDTFRVRNVCFRNNGGLSFEQKSGDWMTMPGSWSGGSAWADLDNDGDLDLVVNNMDDPAFVYQNKSVGKSGNSFLQFQFQGPPSNPFGIGASVGVYLGNQFMVYENNPTRGIYSTVENLAHFGLGKYTGPIKVVVRWPDGKAQNINNILPNTRNVLKYADAVGDVAYLPTPAIGKPLFRKLSPAESGVDFMHRENAFNDFEAWPMHPWSITDLGPYLTKADVDGDGSEDFFVSGGPGQSARLYLQRENGRFVEASRTVFEADAALEDHGACFFDADGDGDMDLVVASGGAEYPDNKAWMLRMYINKDGKGKYERVADGSFPPLESVPSRIVYGDFDGDGDMDLVVAGRTSKGNQWPTSPRTYLLRNDRNKFTDVTEEIAPELMRPGMVTDLCFVQMDATPLPELVLCGEMMPIRVFQLQKGKFVEISEALGLKGTEGLWQCIVPADIDGDRDADFFVGNMGLNSRLTASPEAPMRCYAHDFDGNGELDPVMSIAEGGKDYPLMQKFVLTRQMPILKKEYLYAKDYAVAPVQEIFSKKGIEKAETHTVNYLESVWLENKGGKYVLHKLPAHAQLAPAKGIEISDFNGDGLGDILLVGNQYGMEVETGRFDSGMGCMLLGDGRGTFKWVDNRATGFWANGHARGLFGLIHKTRGKVTYVVANNNAPIEVFLR